MSFSTTSHSASLGIDPFDIPWPASPSPATSPTTSYDIHQHSSYDMHHDISVTLSHIQHQQMAHITSQQMYAQPSYEMLQQSMYGYNHQMQQQQQQPQQQQQQQQYSAIPAPQSTQTSSQASSTQHSPTPSTPTTNSSHSPSSPQSHHSSSSSTSPTNKPVATPSSTTASSTTSAANVIHIPPPKPVDPQIKLRHSNIPATDPLLQQAFSEKVAAKQVKRPRRATKLVVGEKVVPVSRRTKYVKLLETMNLELAAVRQQLHHTQERLNRYEPDWNASQAFGIRSTAHPNKKRKTNDADKSSSTALVLHNSHNSMIPPSSSFTFDHLMPETRQFMVMSLTAQSLHDATYVKSPLMFAKMDLRRRILDANNAFCQNNGWELNEIIGRTLPPGNHAKMFRRSETISELVCKLPSNLVKDLQLESNHDGVAPLKNGLPIGLTAIDLLPHPEMLQAFSKLYTNQQKYATFPTRYINGKGELCECRVTAWIVYEDSMLSTGPTLAHPENSDDQNNKYPMITTNNAQPIVTPADNATSAAALDSLYGLLASFHESQPSPNANPYFERVHANINTALFRCFRHPTLDVGSAIAQTFSCRKPLYVMSLQCPNDITVLRYPATSHPHSQLEQFNRDMQQRWGTSSESRIPVVL